MNVIGAVSVSELNNLILHLNTVLFDKSSLEGVCRKGGVIYGLKLLPIIRLKNIGWVMRMK